MAEPESCRQCGNPVPPDAPGGVCPRCMLNAAVEASTASRDRPTAGPALRAGQIFGSYTLVRWLGQGGFGEVWEAESRDTGRRTALKVLLGAAPASPEALERFQREGRLAASLNHPRCVFVFGAETVDGCPVISMELMPGGTLQDGLAAHGPLPYRQAVDHVLDVIDGLEAAQQAGILHRDVKPSNCFVDSDGRVKIGDFGLSKSLEDEAILTSAGGFAGTPSYASPEQVRGAEMDRRADLYSVGATLYALLSGHPPFRGRSATEILARILTDEPPRFDARLHVPAPLERIVRRLLAKSPEQRYSHYAALRAALLPFATGSLTAAGLARRYVAFEIDRQLLAGMAWLAGAHSLSRSAALLSGLVAVLYFTATEGRWGRSLGKWLLGLRVVGRDDRPIGLRAAFMRSLVWVAFQHVALIPLYWLGSSYQMRPWFALLAISSYLVLTTMRRGNGYAGVHELASGTWVRRVRPRDAPRLPIVGETAAAPPQEATRRFGPYLEGHPLWKMKEESLLVAWDAALRRHVWIHTHEAGRPAPPLAQLAVLRAHGLRWLAGARDDVGGSWDAYEAPRGTSLVDWVESRRGLTWSEVRRVLESTADALGEGVAGPLSIERVWIAPGGSARLLDFPRHVETQRAFPAEEWPSFILAVARFGLTGQRDVSSVREVPPAAIPESARILLERFTGVWAPFESPAELSKELKALAGHPASVSRWRRLGTILVPAGMPLVFMVLIGQSWTLRGRTWAAGRTLLQAQKIQRETQPERQEARRILMAASWRQVPPGSSLSRWPSTWTVDERAALEEARRRHPRVTIEEADQARRLLGEPLRERPALRVDALVRDAPMMLSPPFGLLAVIGLAAMVIAVLAIPSEGGIAFLASGLVVQNADGTSASPARRALRALVTWSPLIPWWLWTAISWFMRTPVLALEDPLMAIAAASLTVGALYALWRPERGLADLVAGTQLVPH